jgi:pimeloyl-ACP methyl ester carboxylesterase
MSDQRSIHAGGLRFNVCDWGGAGLPPLFLLHGLASRLHMFDLIAPSFTDRYHVLAVDQRGHGLSDKPADGYDFETIASDLDGIAAALGYADTPLTVVGHSWGAYTALYYAATRSARTVRAVLLDGGIRPLRDHFPTWAEGEIGLAPPTYNGMTMPKLKQLIRDWQGAGYREESEPLAMTIFDQSNPDDIKPYLNRANNMAIAYHLWAFNPSDYYANVTCPLLIVNAVAPSETPDAALQGYAARAEHETPNAKVVWMRDTIHDMPWHRPQELVAILAAFLQTT